MWSCQPATVGKCKFAQRLQQSTPTPCHHAQKQLQIKSAAAACQATDAGLIACRSTAAIKNTCVRFDLSNKPTSWSTQVVNTPNLRVSSLVPCSVRQPLPAPTTPLLARITNRWVLLDCTSTPLSPSTTTLCCSPHAAAYSVSTVIRFRCVRPGTQCVAPPQTQAPVRRAAMNRGGRAGRQAAAHS